MISAARLAWLQLWRQKGRLFVALAGVGFAVVLMLMQLGFRDALFRSALNLHRRMRAELVMLSPQYNLLITPASFPRRRLYQALAFPGVADATPLYLTRVALQNSDSGGQRDIFVLGFDPVRDPLDIPGVSERRRDLYEQDVVLFDERSRPEYGAIAKAVATSTEPVTRELGRRRVTIRSTFVMGTSFGIDGSIVTSDLNFQRIVPKHAPGSVSVGLVQLVPGADPLAVRAKLAAALPRDVTVLTRQEYMDREVAYWASAQPIGYIFTFGAIMGLVVGAIIVYQILFAGITDHLPEYATMKAMGYRNGYLARVVLAQAVILAVAGFVPGAAVADWLYGVTRSATRMPMELTADDAATVLIATIALCAVSGLIAMRKLRAADPAEMF